MKSITSICCSLLISTILFAQKSPSCCALPLSVTAKNAEMASNENFALAHVNPLPFSLENPKGVMVEFATADGKTAKGYWLKSDKKSKKYLFVFHEWWGLNDHIKKEAEQYYADLEGVNVLAVDLYDGNIATNRENAAKLMGSLSDARARAIVNGAISFAGKKAKIATLGWCMGGAWSLQTAIEGEKHIKACVMYYGFPEMNTEKLKRLHTDVLGIFAEKDAFINVETVKQFEEKIKEVGKNITVYNYVAEHAFANPSNPDYNEQATKDAYQNKVMPYLKTRLKIK
jgi:carboxymethylenebutenolidase